MGSSPSRSKKKCLIRLPLPVSRSGQMWGSIGWHSALMVGWWRIPKPCALNSNARIAHVRGDALHKGTSLLTRAALSPEEHAARKAEIAASLPEPKAKAKPRKDKRSVALEPPLPEKIAKQVKEKQVKRLLRLAQVSDAPLRPAVVVLEDLNVAGALHQRCGSRRVPATNDLQDRVAGRTLAPGRSLVSLHEEVFEVWSGH